MTSLWFEASLAVAIAVAGPMTVTAAVAVTIPRRIHRRVSSVRMMKLLTSQKTRLNTQSHRRWREADEPQYCATDISPGGGEVLLRAIFGPHRITPGPSGDGRRISFRVLHVFESGTTCIIRENVWLDSAAIVNQLSRRQPRDGKSLYDNVNCGPELRQPSTS